MSARVISNGDVCATPDYLAECRVIEAEVDPSLAALLAEQIRLADEVAAARRAIPRNHSVDGSFYDVAELTLGEIRTVMRVCGHKAVVITPDGVTYE